MKLINYLNQRILLWKNKKIKKIINFRIMIIIKHITIKKKLN